MKTSVRRKFLHLALLGAGLLSALATNAQPVITNQPASQNLVLQPGNTNVAFNVGVSGTGPFSYQWLINGTNLPTIITTFCGNTNGQSGKSGDDGPATNAYLKGPLAITMDSTGNIFIADGSNYAIRKIDTNGFITLFAGRYNTFAFAATNGPATNVTIYPVGVLADNQGNIYIADANTQTNRIRKVDTNGYMSTIAGKGVGSSGDGGQATNALINLSLGRPVGMALDGNGNLFFSDIQNNCIRKIATNGIITTFAGTNSPNGRGFSGDGGAATNAKLSIPLGLVFDAQGNLFIADAGNYRVRKVDTNGIITTVAYSDSFSIDPYGLAFDNNGNLYIADDSNRVRMMDTNGNISVIAGNGLLGYTGDGGAATNAKVGCPSSVLIDQSGNVIFTDPIYNDIRKVWLTGFPSLAINKLTPTVAGTYQVIVTGSGGSVTSSVANLSIAYPPFIASGFSSGSSYYYVSWPVFQPSTFQVQWSTNLSGGSWSNLGSTVTYSGTNIINRALFDYGWTNRPQSFYRLVWLQ
jgi:sugar lactone lactonase YvrE